MNSYRSQHFPPGTEPGGEGSEVKSPRLGISQEASPSQVADGNRRLAWTLRVPDADTAAAQQRHLDAAAVRVAGGGLPPGSAVKRIRSGRAGSMLVHHFGLLRWVLRAILCHPQSGQRRPPIRASGHMSRAMSLIISVVSLMSSAAALRWSNLVANRLTSSIFSTKTVPTWPPT